MYKGFDNHNHVNIVYQKRDDSHGNTTPLKQIYIYSKQGIFTLRFLNKNYDC